MRTRNVLCFRATAALLATVMLGAGLLALRPSTAAATTPDRIHYQGFLRETGGDPIDGTEPITLSIYDAETGGTSLWTEDHPAVEVVDGVFSVELGSVDPLSPSLFDGDLWLEVEVAGEVFPRRPLLATPFAMRAAVAEVALSGGGSDTDWVEEDGNIYRASGNVGIGETEPLRRLHLESGELNLESADLSANVDLLVESLDANVHLGSGPGGGTGSSLNLGEWTTGGDFVDNWGLQRLTSGSGSNLNFKYDDGSSQLVVLDLAPDGDVRIRGGAGPVNLHLEADADDFGESDQASISLSQDGGAVTGSLGFFDAKDELSLQLSTAGTTTRLWLGEADLRLEAPGNETLTLGDPNAGAGVVEWDVANEDLVFRTGHSSQLERMRVAPWGVIVSGTTTTDVLQITGGSDLAEPFEVDPSTEVEPGMVLSIDPDHPGRLRVATRAYDPAVAGIASGANGIRAGITLTQTESIADGSVPVALSGRVYCLADASHGAITAGDLLTSSATPGYAMRVADPGRAHGAILGKAMSSLESGRGHVLVLVNLH